MLAEESGFDSVVVSDHFQPWRHQYVDLGFTHLVFHGPVADQERFIRTYGEEILPRLRAAFG